MKNLKLHARVMWRHILGPFLFLLFFPLIMAFGIYANAVDEERAEIERADAERGEP